MKFLNSISDALSFIERVIVVSLLGGMVVLAFTQVILRNFFSSGFLWADPFLRHIVLWIGFLGGSLATQQEKHINLDIVTRFVSSRHKHLIRIATNLFAATVTFMLAKAGVTFLLNELETAETLITIGSVNFPAWWFQIIIPVGFGLMTFRFIIRSIEHTLKAVHPTLEADHPTNIPTIERP
jgi:TRAP-type C4-dicarboxylate transport system permease small subunit